ncbi:hypothetical protein H1R20_g10714, partial [Candolleomyces eurysporus]
MYSSPFPSTVHCASAPLNLIHTNLCGPLPASTPEGYWYWCVFIDDHTRYRIVVLLKRKSDTFTAFQQFKALAENQLGRKIKALHDDKGGEYMSKEFNDLCDKSGILCTHTTRNRPQQNGDAERANRTMLEDITAMLAQANLPASFWGRCLATQVKVWNCLPTASLQGRTLFEGWFGKKPDLSRFRVFGCTIYVFIQKDKRKKLESHMQNKQFIISECAEFNERVFPDLSIKQTMPNAQLQLLVTPASQLAPSNPLPRLDTIPTPPVAKLNTPSPAASPASVPFFDLPPPPPAVPEPAPQPSAAPVALRRSQGEVKKPRECALHLLHEIRFLVCPPPAAPVALPKPPPGPAPQLVPPSVDNWEPRDPSPAVADSDDTNSDLGGHAEVHAVQQLVELPPGEKAVPSGWVFKTEQTSTGDVECYKGRVVAKGCSQHLRIDYDDTYSPTFRAAALRTRVAAVDIEDMELRSVDISAATLSATSAASAQTQVLAIGLQPSISFVI